MLVRLGVESIWAYYLTMMFKKTADGSVENMHDEILPILVQGPFPAVEAVVQVIAEQEAVLGLEQTSCLPSEDLSVILDKGRKKRRKAPCDVRKMSKRSVQGFTHLCSALRKNVTSCTSPVLLVS